MDPGARHRRSHLDRLHLSDPVGSAGVLEGHRAPVDPEGQDVKLPFVGPSPRCRRATSSLLISTPPPHLSLLASSPPQPPACAAPRCTRVVSAPLLFLLLISFLSPSVSCGLAARSGRGTMVGPERAGLHDLARCPTPGRLSRKTSLKKKSPTAPKVGRGGKRQFPTIACRGGGKVRACSYAASRPASPKATPR